MICYTNKHRIPFIIDDSDWDIVSQYTWCKANGYPRTSIKTPTNWRCCALHLLLLGPAPPGLFWDHHNRDKMDNRRNNIRAVTMVIQKRNEGLRSDNTSGVRGVHQSHHGYWVANIKDNNGNQITLGEYTLFESAVIARQEAEKKYWGDNR